MKKLTISDHSLTLGALIFRDVLFLKINSYKIRILCSSLLNRSTLYVSTKAHNNTIYARYARQLRTTENILSDGNCRGWKAQPIGTEAKISRSLLRTITGSVEDN